MVLQKASVISIEAYIHRHRFPWVGHVALTTRRNALRQIVILYSTPDAEWGTADFDPNKWRHTIHDGSKIFQEHAMNMGNVNRATRKGEIIDPAINQLTCDECGRVYFSNAGPISQKKIHIGRPFKITISTTLEIKCKVCQKK